MTLFELSNAITSARALFSLHRTLIVKTALAATASALIFGAGFTTATYLRAQQAEKAADTKVEQVVKQVVVRDEVERKVYVQDLATVRALEAEKNRLTEQVADLQGKVNVYVPEVPTGAYVSRGAISLLDDAATGNATPATAATGNAADEDTAPSDVSWRDLVSDGLSVRLRYNVARNQCNALIDWVETNVVNKPLGQ